MNKTTTYLINIRQRNQAKTLPKNTTKNKNLFNKIFISYQATKYLTERTKTPQNLTFYPMNTITLVFSETLKMLENL